MRNRDSAFRYRVFGHAAFVVCAAGLAASCSNATRFQEPFFTGSTENQREIIGQADTSQPMPPALPSRAVTSSNLPPPPNATASVPAYPAYPAAPASDVVAQNTGNYGWSGVGGQVVTVRAGQTLDSLAAQYGVPQEQLLSANQMRSAADVRPGRVIVIPHRVALAPDTTIKPTPVSYTPAAAKVPLATSGATTHTVTGGDTLYSIARRYGTTVSELVALNHLPSAEAIHTGQVLRLPGAGRMAEASIPAVRKPAEASASPTKPTQVASVDPQVKIPAQPKATEPSADATAWAPSAPNAPGTSAAPTAPVAKINSNDPAAAGAAVDQAADSGSTTGTEFRWPVRGRIIAGFGTKPNGEKNDGINLAVPEGTAVKAAEAGTVIYAGNELEGYGNLVLIRHADGWVSAYANNKDITVQRGDKVRRGEVIAHAGMTGSVTSPQVHFELRKGAKPVNPLNYLAS